MHIRWRVQRPNRPDSFLGWSPYFFVVIGVLSLSYVGFALVDASLHQAYQSSRFQRALENSRTAIGSYERQPLPLTASKVERNRAKSESAYLPVEGSPLGRIEIGSIGVAAMILEGTDKRTLRRAVGHIRSTPLPGQRGNVALAGHRDTYFRGLRDIRINDEITLTTLSGSYRYRVDATKVVKPEETEVLKDNGAETLTLVTCYPFNFVGSAPRRFIVRARRVLE